MCDKKLRERVWFGSRRRHVVTQSTGCDHPQAFEDIYKYFAEPEAWRLTTPDVRPALQRLRDAGVGMPFLGDMESTDPANDLILAYMPVCKKQHEFYF